MSDLASAWDEAAAGYERYFVPRFAPWVDAAVTAVTGDLPPGPLLVPCCGTFPELPALAAAHPEREIVGIDLSPGMVDLARARAVDQPRVRVEVGDAARLAPEWTERCAGVVSVFGLQQLPDPEAAIAAWVRALRPGGRLSVMYWPARVESDGPFAVLSRVLATRRPPAEGSWADRLAAAAVGAAVEHDDYRTFPMRHDDAATFWSAMTNSGPLRALANARGQEFMREVGREFLSLAPSGPLRHEPSARWLVVRRDQPV